MSTQIVELDTSDINKINKLKQTAKRNRNVPDTLVNKLESNKIDDIDKYRLANPTHSILLWEKISYDKHGNIIGTEKIATNFESIAGYIVGSKIT